jgi:DNA polymerase I-like protein with 3'-5' exonuclease and polymerase domains
MMHCWFSELPKDLASLNSFFVRNSMYWKDLAETDDKYEYYKYNALDSYATALVAITWLIQAPKWAKTNYLQEFPVAYPCVLSEMTGVKRDLFRLEVAKKTLDTEIAGQQARLETLTATKGINPNSPKQVKELLAILGCKDITSTNEKDLKIAAARHPINSRILNLILDIRGNRKLVSTYLCDGKELDGTILYSITPWATDTGRLASKEHHFWCGLQIQNIPRGKAVKSTIIAYEGFRFAECDLKQAESRDTAYIAGEENLIKAVTGERDFHSVNASSFFGTPYEKIYDDTLNKVIDKVLRDLAKRVNHGANYNMGAAILVETMGEEAVRKAQLILGLNRFWSLIQVAQYLLDRFHSTYPNIKGKYYPKVIADVTKTKMLVGATGWTRYCFGDPANNKRDLNALVAHCPQSLNAMKLNKAYMRVFYEIAINPKYSQHFKLCAQIHDSILFQFRVGHEYLIQMVVDLMQVPVTVKGADGIERTYTVPADAKAGADGKGSIYWSDTE